MQYQIYKLQNKINGKVYIGKTKRTLPVRMKDHRNTSCCTYLHRAIKKYGEDAFSKEILYTTTDESDVCIKEREFILQYNSLAPNGYNLVLDTNRGRTSHQITRNLMASNMQGICRSIKHSKYIGVRTRLGSRMYFVRITKRKKTYSYYYSDIIEAAEAYDKVALYLYGFNARINFPEKLNDYRNINLKLFFKSFCKKHIKKSKYVGVTKMTSYDTLPWRAYAYENKKQISLGVYKSEEEAYEARKSYLKKTRGLV
jgi:group I intron endonuclease